jgi:hypothetical protein
MSEPLPSLLVLFRSRLIHSRPLTKNRSALSHSQAISLLDVSSLTSTRTPDDDDAIFRHHHRRPLESALSCCGAGRRPAESLYMYVAAAFHASIATRIIVIGVRTRADRPVTAAMAFLASHSTALPYSVIIITAAEVRSDTCNFRLDGECDNNLAPFCTAGTFFVVLVVDFMLSRSSEGRWMRRVEMNCYV